MLGGQQGEALDALAGSSQEAAECDGLLPQAAKRIFQHIESERESAEFRVSVAFLEIYNEQIYDLLAPQSMAAGGKKGQAKAGTGTGGQGPRDRRDALTVREDILGAPFIPGLREEAVGSTQEVMALVEQALRERVVRHTEYNQHSSRGHAIFTMNVDKRPFSEAGSSPGKAGKMTRAKLNLVDLAGSEKWRKDEAGRAVNLSEDRFGEMTSINQSLSVLANCIAAQTEQNRSHVPFRDSKLTFLLKDSLGGNSKTTLVATMSPGEQSAEESSSTLQFAVRASKVTCKATVNEVVEGDSAEVMRIKYEGEIMRLRQQLRLHQGQPGGGPGGSVPKGGGPGGGGTELDTLKFRISILEQDAQGQRDSLERGRKALKKEKTRANKIENELKEAKLEIQWMRGQLKEQGSLHHRRGIEHVSEVSQAWGSPEHLEQGGSWNGHPSSITIYGHITLDSTPLGPHHQGGSWNGSQTARPSGSQGARTGKRKPTAGRKRFKETQSEAELFESLNLGGKGGGAAGGKGGGSRQWVDRHVEEESAADWMAGLSLEDRMVLEELERQEADLAAIRAEAGECEGAMRQIEQGETDYAMPDSRHHRNPFEEALMGGGEGGAAHDAEVAQMAGGKRAGTPRSRRLLEASSNGGGYQPPGGPPRLPKPPSRAASNDAQGLDSKGKPPRKNWKNDLGNWIYILGTTSSSMTAKNVAQKNSIENYAPVRGNRANT